MRRIAGALKRAFGRFLQANAVGAGLYIHKRFTGRWYKGCLLLDNYALYLTP
jgi:hypothetical protein